MAAPGSGSGVAASDCHDNTAVTNPLPDGITPASACLARGLLWRPAPVGTAVPPSLGDAPAPLCPPRGTEGLWQSTPSPPQRRAGGVSPRPRCKVPAAPVHPGAGRAGSPRSVLCPVPARGHRCPQEACCHQSTANCPGGLSEPGLVCRKAPTTTRALRFGVRGSAKSHAIPLSCCGSFAPSFGTEVRGIASAGAPGSPGTPSLLLGACKAGGRPPLLFPRVRPVALVTP